MAPRDIVLAAAVAVIWGVAFVATVFALESFTPPQLTAIRFILAALPVVFIGRPPVTWGLLIVLGSFLFIGQFMVQFFAFEAGLPPGVASVAIHTQALFTVLLAAIALGERPNRIQIAGLAVAVGGMVLVGASVGGNLTPLGFGLALVAAMSWAIGNTILKRLGPVDMLRLMFWLSVVPPLPALIVSTLMGDDPGFIDAVRNASIESILAALYLGLVATAVAFAIWGRLLNTYKAVQVAPFALLAPVAATVTSYLVLGETFGPLRGAGMLLIMAGVAVTLFSKRGQA